jgi:TolB protein
MIWRRCGAAALLLGAAAGTAAGQDTTRADPGVRIGITYTPGTRPALAVAGSRDAALDSVRAVLARDLDHSDRFEMVARAGATDERTLAALGVDWAVLTALAGEAAEVRLVELRTGAVRLRTRVPLAGAETRAALHRAADAIVHAASGQPGIAASALLFVRGGRIWKVDADGHGAQPLRTAGAPALSPAWSPDGRRFAYTAFVPAGQPLVIQDLATGAREVVPTTEDGLNITPSWSPDGRRLAFARGTEAGTDIYLYDVARRCCLERLTAGRGDNLSPVWSPDGSRLAFISTRARTPQLYGMASDGTGQEVLARFDYGATGTTSAPSWSPDGALIAFHREVQGDPQLFVLDVRSGSVRQLTGSGRNEDPTFAPDGRHLAFVSTRGGARDLWVLDLETGRVRPLTRGGGARLPAWSPRPYGMEGR